MPTLSLAQMSAYARSAGFTPNQAATMAAIGMAESSGRTWIVNSTGHVGIWQISPEHRAEHPTWTESWLKNPANNARAAKTVYNKQGYQAWEAFTKGRSDKYIKEARKVTPGATDEVFSGRGERPLDSIIGEDASDALSHGLEDAVIDPLSGITSFAAKAGNWLSNPTNWLRIGYAVIGGLMAVGGLVIVAKPVLGPVASATPLGRVAKLARSAGKGST